MSKSNVLLAFNLCSNTGSLEIGASLGAVHGVGRAIPLILLSVLAIIGVNYTRGITVNRENIEKLTGWLLIVIGAFLIINGIPGGHEWYENTIIHTGWNNLVSTTLIPPEFHVGLRREALVHRLHLGIRC